MNSHKPLGFPQQFALLAVVFLLVGVPLPPALRANSPAPAESSISGRVTDGSGNGIGGVIIWATAFPWQVYLPVVLGSSASGVGSASDSPAQGSPPVEAYSATTDADGYYSFTSLPVKSYTLRAEKTGLEFMPATRTVSLPATGDQNFVGSVLTPIIPYTTKVISGATGQYLETISVDGADFTFSQDTPELEALEVGDIMVSEPVTAAPYGFLRRVTGKTTQDSKIIVSTEPAALEDAVTQASFSYNEPFDPTAATIQMLEQLPGITVTPSGPASGCTGCFTVNFDNVVLKATDSDPVGVEVVANGTAEFKITPHLSWDIRNGNPENVRIVFDSETHSSLKVAVKGTGSNTFIHRNSITVAKFVLGVLTIFLGPLPVVVVPEVTVDVGVDGKIGVGAEWGIESDITRGTAGLEWHAGDILPTTISRQTREPVTPATPKFFFEAEVKGYVEIGPVLKLYGVAGPFAKMRVYLRGVATVNVAPDPGVSFSVYLGGEIPVGLDTGFLKMKLEVIIRIAEILIYRWPTNPHSNTAPDIPYAPSPGIGATGVGLDEDLDWTGSDPDGDALTYDVYLEAGDTTPDKRISFNYGESAYDPGTLLPGTHYYWQIIARDEHGASTTGPVWDFATSSSSALPDLVVVSLTITSMTSNHIAYSYTIKNTGDAPANLDGPTSANYDNVNVQAVLSDDTIFFNQGDVPAGGSILGGSPLGYLDPGETFSGSYASSTSVDPSTMNYFILKVDYGNVVEESDETNNTLPTSIP